MMNLVCIIALMYCIGSNIDLPAPEISEPVIYEEVKSTAPEFSDEELDLLYREINAEAGGDGTESQKACTTVILNRLFSPRYPDNITDVIYAEGQFATPSGIYTDEVINSVNEAISEYGTPDQILPYTCYYFRAHHYHDFGIPYTHYGNTYFSLSEEATD